MTTGAIRNALFSDTIMPHVESPALWMGKVLPHPGSSKWKGRARALLIKGIQAARRHNLVESGRLAQQTAYIRRLHGAIDDPGQLLPLVPNPTARVPLTSGSHTLMRNNLAMRLDPRQYRTIARLLRSRATGWRGAKRNVPFE